MQSAEESRFTLVSNVGKKVRGKNPPKKEQSFFLFIKTTNYVPNSDLELTWQL